MTSTVVTPVPLARLTTLRTGGVPSRMLDARTRDDLVGALREVWSGGGDWFVLGGGSNLFVGDDPYDGTVIRVRSHGIDVLPSPRPDHLRLRVQAGHPWDDVVAFAVTHDLGGIEALSGIPGTVGAAPVQNVGAYGQEIMQTLVDVELIDEADGRVRRVPAEELELGFRTSVLKRHYGVPARRSAVILDVTLELRVRPGVAPVPGAQLRAALGVEDDEPVTLRRIRENIRATRIRKGMVLDADDPDTYSAGSFFQNAVVSASFARTLPAELPQWPVCPDMDVAAIIPLAEYTGSPPAPHVAAPDVKISSAWLIEHSGFGKGFHLPRSRAWLSTKHALALTNHDGATAAEIAELGRYIRLRVGNEFGLELQPEPVLVGVDL